MEARSVILILIGSAFVFQTIRSLRKMRFREQNALLFLFVSIPFLILAFWPKLLVLAANKMEMEYVTLVVITYCTFLLMLVFKLVSIVSIQQRKINTLTQHVAILMEKQNLVDRGPAPETAGQAIASDVDSDSE